jgi:serine/threonine-protein kinase
MAPTTRYQIQGELGRGGMGVVSLALDTLLKRQVAIKSMQRGGTEYQAWHDMLRRLVREAQAAASLSHPNIVAIFDVIPDDDSPSIVMEYIRGKTLSEIAQPGVPVDPRLAIGILRQCAAAIDHAESRGIVHRDIKPSNIMVDEAGMVKLTDFGIAKPLNSSTDLTHGMAVGTLEYMSPEQLESGPLSSRTDQYSLAVVAYKILTGWPIFESDTLGSWCAKLLNETPIAPSRRNPALPGAVDSVLARAMAKKAQERYGSCGEFVNRLEEALRPDAAPEVRPTVAEPTQTIKRGSFADWVRILGISAAAAAVIASAAIYLSAPGRKPKAKIDTTVSVVEPPHVRLARQIADFRGDMVLVDGGEGRVGQNRDIVSVDSFYIDKTEVTNRAYTLFCQETGHLPAPGSDPAAADYPVVNVSFDDAQAFARWANKRLPTAIEWEKAARGSQGYQYPWGNDVRDNAANLGREGQPAHTVAPADSLPEGASPYGALNMLGNVWEWVATEASPPEGAEFQRYQKVFALSPPLLRTEKYYQIRGGSYKLDTRADEVATLLWNESVAPARANKRDIGFRCARTP